MRGGDVGFAKGDEEVGDFGGVGRTGGGGWVAGSGWVTRGGGERRVIVLLLRGGRPLGL